MVNAEVVKVVEQREPLGWDENYNVGPKKQLEVGGP